MSAELTVYGASWCGDTRRTCAQLDAAKISYTYIELDHSLAAAVWVRDHNDGRERKPTLRLVRPPEPDVILSTPTNAELTAWLKKYQIA